MSIRHSLLAALIVTAAASLAAADQPAAANSPAACRAPPEPWTEILLVPVPDEVAGKVETVVNANKYRFKQQSVLHAEAALCLFFDRS